MLPEGDKVTLTALTVCLDLFLVGILFFTETARADRTWIAATLLSHGLFLKALAADDRKTLDVLHVFVFLLPLFALFTSNVMIKAMSLVFLLVIQYLWLIKKRCILNEKDDAFGYGQALDVFVKCLTGGLLYHIVFCASKKRDARVSDCCSPAPHSARSSRRKAAHGAGDDASVVSAAK